jgi:hypothetical protein
MTAIAGLDPGEQTRCVMPVSFAGSAGTSVRGAFSVRAGKIRRDAVMEWARAADACGFPFAGGDMILGVTDQGRIHVWRPRFFRARPGEHRGWFPLARVVQVGVTRHVAALRLTLLVDDGTMISVESMRVKRLRRFADTISADLSGR